MKTVMGIPFWERTKPILPNHRVYDPAKENERENYYYSLLLLFIPFRNEADLIEEGETAKSAFKRHLEQNDELNTYSEKLERMLIAREHVQQMNEARRAREEDITTEPGPEEDDVVDLRQNSDTERNWCSPSTPTRLGCTRK